LRFQTGKVNWKEGGSLKKDKEKKDCGQVRRHPTEPAKETRSEKKGDWGEGQILVYELGRNSDWQEEGGRTHWENVADKGPEKKGQGRESVRSG